MRDQVFELKTGTVAGGFFAERDESGACNGMKWSPEAGHQLHVLASSEEKMVAVGISTASSVIMGVMMTAAQAEAHIADVRRMIERAHGSGTA